MPTARLLFFALALTLVPLVALAQDPTSLDNATFTLDPTMVEALATWLAANFGWGATALFIAGLVILVANVVDQLWPDEKQPAVVRGILDVCTAFAATARRWIDAKMKAKADTSKTSK